MIDARTGRWVESYMLRLPTEFFHTLDQCSNVELLGVVSQFDLAARQWLTDARSAQDRAAIDGLLACAEVITKASAEVFRAYRARGDKVDPRHAPAELFEVMEGQSDKVLGDVAEVFNGVAAGWLGRAHAALTPEEVERLTAAAAVLHHLADEVVLHRTLRKCRETLTIDRYEDDFRDVSD